MSPKPPEKTRSDKSCLPSCFGFSRSVSDCTGTKEQLRFSWWRSLVRKSGVKLVPVDAAAITQQAKRGRVSGLEVGKSVHQTGKHPIYGKTERNSGRKQDAGDVVSDHGGVGKPRKPKYGCRQPPSETQIPNPDSGNPNIASTASRDATCQAQLALKTRSRSPEIKPETGISQQKHDGKNDNAIGKFRPTVGLLILMVILAIMLLCGRMCAIVCTSAWFYLIPRLRPATNSGEATGDAMDSQIPDLDSEEHKKKVILEGLLQRNRRTRPVVVL